MIKFNNALGLDIGDKYIGVARINAIAQIPEPLTTLTRSGDWGDQLQLLIVEHHIDVIVCGVPRNMSGQETQQSRSTRSFIEHICTLFPDMHIEVQDETLSTVDALELLKTGIKGDKDSVAAGYILADFITSYRRQHV